MNGFMSGWGNQRRPQGSFSLPQDFSISSGGALPNTGFKLPDQYSINQGGALPSTGFKMPSSMADLSAPPPVAPPTPQETTGIDAILGSMAKDAMNRAAADSAQNSPSAIDLGRPNSGYRAPALYQSNFQPTSPAFGRKAAFYAGR